MPCYPRSDKLTGATRYRTSRFGEKLILQVEEIYQVGYGGRPQPGQPTHFPSTRWRDACVSDLPVIDYLHSDKNGPPPERA